MQIRKGDKKYVCTYAASIIGVIVGCLILLVSILYGDSKWMDYGLEDYDISGMLNISQQSLVFYLLKKRILQIFIFVLVSVLLGYYGAAALFCGGFGIYYGIILTNLILKFGVKGMLYGCACFFPHYLIYFLIIVLAGKWIDKQKKILKTYYQNVNWIEIFVKLFVIIFLLTISFLWELKFQKNFLNYFFQYLV